LECNYLNWYIEEKITEEIQQFLSGIVKAIETNLRVNLGRSAKGTREVKTNFTTFQPFLGTMFKE
jgi:hypothetical protein